MLGSLKKYNIIKFPHKATSSEYLDKIHQVFLDFISENMSALLKTGKCFSVNTTYITTISYYVIKFLSEAYTLQEDTTCYGKINTSG